MSDIDWRTKGGQATSRKKTKACRQNAKQPRPGRTEFNRLVNYMATTYSNLAERNRQALIEELTVGDTTVSPERAAKILDSAIKRQKQ